MEVNRRKQNWGWEEEVGGRLEGEAAEGGEKKQRSREGRWGEISRMLRRRSRSNGR